MKKNVASSASAGLLSKKGRRKPTKFTSSNRIKPKKNPVKKWVHKERAASKEEVSVSVENAVPEEEVVIDVKPRGNFAYADDPVFSRYLTDVGKTALLTPDEERDLAIKKMRGDKKAAEHLIRANLRLVIKIAKDYANMGLPLLDLISEGSIGLMKAIERFDPDYGAKVSTYASWWIKQGIKRALADQSKTVRLPVHLVDKISKMKRVITSLHEVLGREPTDEEIAGELGISENRVAALRTFALSPVSLDHKIGDEDGSDTIQDVLPDENAEIPSNELIVKTQHQLLHEVVKALDPREAAILNFRFGLDGEEPRTLEEVGKMFKVTRERIRQVQNIALGRLRKAIEMKNRIQVPLN